MTTQTLAHHADDDTLQVSRPADLLRPTVAPRRLAEMDLDPPAGPVPADVLAYFERAVERERGGDARPPRRLRR